METAQGKVITFPSQCHGLDGCGHFIFARFAHPVAVPVAEFQLPVYFGRVSVH